MPVGKLVTHGVWENERYVGAVIYGRGANNNLGVRFDLDQTGFCELVRVALSVHTAPTTQIVATSIYLLRETNPRMRLVISFADSAQGHIGTIYQAGNWIYTGATSEYTEVYYRGKWHHPRSMRPTGWGTLPEIARVAASDRALLPSRTRGEKYRYLMPLDKQMRRRVVRDALPYPARADEGSEASRPVTDREG
jgi:hypothetical protein